MFFIIVTQLLELQIPVFLIGLALALVIEIKTNFVEHPFSFRIHFAISGACTLIADPIAQCQVFLVYMSHFICNAGKESGEVLVWVFFR
jgi:hypothetical protein